MAFLMGICSILFSGVVLEDSFRLAMSTFNSNVRILSLAVTVCTIPAPCLGEMIRMGLLA